jgi:hypothetical protein
MPSVTIPSGIQGKTAIACWMEVLKMSSFATKHLAGSMTTTLEGESFATLSNAVAVVSQELRASLQTNR